MRWVEHKNCIVFSMRWRVKRWLNHENVELTLSRLSQFFESQLLFYIERIVSLMETIMFNSIQVINYWFTLHRALRPLYQQAQTSSLNIWGISDQDVTLRKTSTAYLFMCIYALWAYAHMKIHWSILLLCLSDVMIDQWRKMREQFSELTIVLAYDNKLKSLIALKLNWINVSTFKKTLQNFTEWSLAISYMWDITDSWAFKVVLLTSYDMWTTHTVKMRKKTQLISEESKEIQILYSD